jgi:hypothetical protein
MSAHASLLAQGLLQLCDVAAEYCTPGHRGGHGFVLLHRLLCADDEADQGDESLTGKPAIDMLDDAFTVMCKQIMVASS